MDKFYLNWLIKEVYDFEAKTGIKPTHCIVESDIYRQMERESILNFEWYFNNKVSDVRYFGDKEITCYGITIKKGKSKELFTFYKEEK